jgi:pantoate--beta-alanine ligase
MIIAKTIAETRKVISHGRAAGKSIGLVATMGALHEGHVSLIGRCHSECDYTVVSIFVNPTQFGPNEDLAKYPRTFDGDCRMCEAGGVDLIFAPDDKEMYPCENLTWVDVDKLGEHLCGASRPGHFRGVCTVVAKLFNIVRPDFAYFGEKDAQQLAIIGRMVSDLNIPVEIRRCPTVRAEDGLALSSRNKNLNAQQRQQACSLYQALSKAKELITAGQVRTSIIIRAITEIVARQPQVEIDYISVVDKDLLQPIKQIDRPVLIALAVRVGGTRLIDNIIIDPGQKNT